MKFIMSFMIISSLLLISFAHADQNEYEVAKEESKLQTKFSKNKREIEELRNTNVEQLDYEIQSLQLLDDLERKAQKSSLSLSESKFQSELKKYVAQSKVGINARVTRIKILEDQNSFIEKFIADNNQMHKKVFLDLIRKLDMKLDVMKVNEKLSNQESKRESQKAMKLQTEIKISTTKNALSEPQLNASEAEAKKIVEKMFDQNIGDLNAKLLNAQLNAKHISDEIFKELLREIKSVTVVVPAEASKAH